MSKVPVIRFRDHQYLRTKTSDPFHFVILGETQAVHGSWLGQKFISLTRAVSCTSIILSMDVEKEAKMCRRVRYRAGEEVGGGRLGP